MSRRDRKATTKKRELDRIYRINSMRRPLVDPVNPVKKLAHAAQTFTANNTETRIGWSAKAIF